MGKDKTKEKERHRTIRRNKKERLTKLEMLETYLEKHHSNILEEFEVFYESSKIVTSTTPAEKPPLLDTVKLKDDSTITSLPEQDANLKLPTPDDLLQDLEWDDIVWNDALLESTDFDIDQFLDTVLK